MMYSYLKLRHYLVPEIKSKASCMLEEFTNTVTPPVQAEVLEQHLTIQV